MAEKYQNKYRIASARMKNYDYSSNGAYFVTIVTKNRKCFFGKIVDGKMILNEIGKIVWDEWLISEKIRKNIILNKFVVMPNHIHGIVIINNDLPNTVVETLRRNVSTTPILRRNVSTTSTRNNYIGNNKNMSDISPKKSSLSHMIRELKSAITRKSREILPDFAWQTRFHDRIIRNENELNRIRKYIVKNPEMWMRDKNNGDLWI